MLIWTVLRRLLIGIKKAVKAIIKLIKVIASGLGWVIFIIFIILLLSALLVVGERALDNLIGEDWNYHTYEKDLAFITQLYDSGYESVISAENFQDFKAFEYAVLMDAAEYLRNNKISVLPVPNSTNQAVLEQRGGQTRLDQLVLQGANARSVNIDGEIAQAGMEGNNTRVTRPLLVYEFKISTLNQDELLSGEGSGENTTEKLLEDGKLKGSLEPYVYIIRDDIIYSYYFYNVGNQPRVVEYSMILNAYNSTLNIGREGSKQLSEQTLGASSIKVFPDHSYGEVPYFTDSSTNIIYKIPLRTILGRYLPRAELLQAWALLKQDVDEPDAEKTDIVDEVLASIKGVYNEACLSSETFDTKTEVNDSGEKFLYSDASTDNATFASFVTMGLESTDYGINGLLDLETGDSTDGIEVDEFVSAVTLSGSIMIRYWDRNLPIKDSAGNIIGYGGYNHKNLTIEEVDGLSSTIESFSGIKAGEGSPAEGYDPPAVSDSSVETIIGVLRKKENEIDSVIAQVEAELSGSFPRCEIVTRDAFKYTPVFLTSPMNINKKLKINHSRMPVLMIDNVTTWARKINYTFHIEQNKFKSDNKYYIIPSCVSSMGLEYLEVDIKDDLNYRGKAYKDIFARMREKDVINSLLQLEQSAILGANDCYEYMRDLYKLVKASQEYSQKNPSDDPMKNIHEDTYKYVYIPKSVLNYDDASTQHIYWLNLFAATKDDPISKEELETMKTKDEEITWQIVEYEKYPECSDNGKVKVYALSPFGSAYTRAFYQHIYETGATDYQHDNLPEDIVGSYEGTGGHTGCDWGGRNTLKKTLNTSSPAGKAIYNYELERLKNLYSEEEAEKRLKTELKTQIADNPIVAIAPGKVETVAYQSRAGFYVKVNHSSGDSVVSDYLHMKRWPLVSVGDYVGAGTLLGYEGNTGRSYGSHLHFEINDGVIAPYDCLFPAFNPFYNEERAQEENYNLSSEYMSLYRTVSLVDASGGKPVKETTGADFVNQHPKDALVDDYNNLIQRQGESDRKVTMSGEIGWNSSCDDSATYIKHLESEKIYDIYMEKAYFDKKLAMEQGYLDIPSELYSAIYGNICVNTEMPGSLPALTVDELKQILKNWLPSRYNEKEVAWLMKNVFTDATIKGVVEAQDEYSVSAVFALAVATLEQQMGLSYYRNNNHFLGKPGIHNIFSIKGSIGGGVRYQGGKLWNKYASYSDAFMGFSRLIGESGPYFREGRYTIADIGPTYCDEAWIGKVTGIVMEIMQYYTGNWSSLPPEITIGNVGSNQKLMNAVKNCILYYKGKGFKYCMCGHGNRLVPPYSGSADASVGFSNLPVRQRLVDCTERNDGTAYRTDCSTYCSWVIYEYAKANGWTELQSMFSSQNSSGAFETHANRLKNGANTGAYQYMTLVWHRGRGDSEASAKQLVQEGDILIYRQGCHHVDFSAGTWGKVYSCGSTNGIQAGDKPTNGKPVSKLTAIIRLK